MQHRLGRCDACRASYEIPASYLPRFARCRLCRGMVRIGRAGAIGSADNTVAATYCKGQTWSNVFFYQGTLRTNNTLGFAMAMSWCANQTFTDCTFCPSVNLITCANYTFTGTVTLDRMASTTLTTYPTSSFVLATRCADILIDGLSQGGFSNLQPYNSLVSITACDRIKVRNIGTPSAQAQVRDSKAAAGRDGGTRCDVRAASARLLEAKPNPGVT